MNGLIRAELSFGDAFQASQPLVEAKRSRRARRAIDPHPRILDIRSQGACTYEGKRRD